MTAMHNFHPSTLLRPIAALASLLVVGSAWSVQASALDWSGVEEHQVTMFHPGQASWEWVLTQDDHSGAKKFREGKNCRGCHEGEEADIGNKIISGEKLEPQPNKVRPGSIPLKVQVAHDGTRLYFRLRWPAIAAGGSPMDAAHVARATVILDDGKIKEAGRAGCWASCHDDAAGMASAAKGGDMTKYLGASRAKLTRQGGGQNLKAKADLEQLRTQGGYLEYWQALISAPGKVQGVGGYILDARHEVADAGVEASAQLTNGEWTVIVSRALKPAGASGKTIAAGSAYALGFALHDGHVNHRYHHVSFEHTLVLDSGTADFVAKKR